MDISGTLCFHLHRFFQSLHQGYTTLGTRILARIKGIELGSGLTCRGIPYFYRTPHSQIVIGRDCSIWSSFRSNQVGSMHRSRICTMSPDARIRIGDNVGMSAVTITAHGCISIGDHTMIGADTVIIDSDFHNLSSADPAVRHNQLGAVASVNIGKNVFIGTRCTILKGVTIGDNAVVGAGSIVTKDIPSGARAAGNPCCILSHR